MRLEDFGFCVSMFQSERHSLSVHLSVVQDPTPILAVALADALTHFVSGSSSDSDWQEAEDTPKDKGSGVSICAKPGCLLSIAL